MVTAFSSHLCFLFIYIENLTEFTLITLSSFWGPFLTTPTTFVVPRKGEYKLVISKEGYQPQEVIIGNKVVGKGATGMAGNIILGGVIGLGVDAATGAAKDLIPNPVHVLLVGEGEESLIESNTDEITELEEIDSEPEDDVIIAQEEVESAETSTTALQEE